MKAMFDADSFAKAMASARIQLKAAKLQLKAAKRQTEEVEKKIREGQARSIRFGNVTVYVVEPDAEETTDD